MINTVLSYMPTAALILGLVGVTILSLFLIKNHWRNAAIARESNWTVEAFIVILGPIRQLGQFVTDQNPSLAPLSTGVRITEALLLLAVIIGGLRNTRKSARTAILLLSLYYAALFLSGIFGAVVSLPEPYYLTPLIVIFLGMNGTISADALARIVQFSLRMFAVLSVIALIFWPSSVFRVEGDRSLLGLDQFQGITTHPNSIAFLSLLGLIFELTRHRRLIFVVIYSAIIVAAQSSTAYLLVCGCLLAIALIRLRSTRLLLVLSGAVILAAAPFSELGYKSLFSWLPSDFSTFTGRDRIWEAAIAGSSEYRFFGFGPTLLDDAFRARLLGEFDAAAQAHNQFVQDFAGAGAVGLLALLTLSTYLVVSGARSAQVSGGLTLALMIALLGRMFTETPLRPTGLELGSFFLIATVSIVVAYTGCRLSPNLERVEAARTRLSPEPKILLGSLATSRSSFAKEPNRNDQR